MIIKQSTHGFTLVELAIALMVIGLLIGGVLKGQELIENARVTAAVRQFKAYETASLIFKNTYNAWPGDIKRPNRIPNCNTDDGNTCGIGGNGNGRTHYDASLSPAWIESYNFFPHLTKAGLIQGPEGGTTADISATDLDKFMPESILPMSGGATRFYVYYHNNSPALHLRAGHYYEFLGLACKHAAVLDEKMDDGKPDRGEIREWGDCHADDGEGNIEYERTGTYSEMIIPVGF